MSSVKIIALLSCLGVVACGGGSGSDGSSGGSDAGLGFASDKPAKLDFRAIAYRPGFITSKSSNSVDYDPKTGAIRMDEDYDGNVRQGTWQQDQNGNRILMTDPAGTKYVRQIEVVRANDGDPAFDRRWYRGAIGFETTQRPTAGTATYNGTTSGMVQSWKPVPGTNYSEGVLTDFTGKVRAQVDLANGTGNYRLSDIKATDGSSPAPFRSLSADIVVGDGSRITAVRGNAVVNSGPGQPLGAGQHHSANGALFGPQAQEIGAGYYVSTQEGHIEGAFVGKR